MEESNITRRNPAGIIGTKLFTFKDNPDKADVYRVVRRKPSNGTYKLMHEVTKKTIIVTDEDIFKPQSDYIILNPDGYLSICIAHLEDSDISKDIMVCLHKRSEMSDPLPYAICRQFVEDFFINKTTLHDPRRTYIGCSVSKDTCPPNFNYGSLLGSKENTDMKIGAVYLDDTLEDLNEYLSSGMNWKKYDTVLYNDKCFIERKDTNKAVQGACSSVYELLKSNHFLYDFESAFGIKTCAEFEKFEINEGDTSLDIQYVPALERMVDVKRIIATYVFPYSKEINLSEFERDYVLVRPSNTKQIYVIGYDVYKEPIYTAPREERIL